MSEEIEKKIKEAVKVSEFEQMMFNLKWGIENILKALKVIPQKLHRDIQDTKEYGFSDLSRELTRTVEAIKTFEEQANKKREDMTAAFENWANTTYDNHTAAKRKLEAMPEIKIPDIDTYNLEKVLDLCGKVDRVPLETWERFRKIAYALSITKDSCTDDCPYKTFKDPKE